MKKNCLYTYLVIHVLAMMQGPLAWAQAFKHEPISDKLFKAMQAGNTFHENSPVPRERLCLLTVQHVDFEGNTQTGQLVVLDTCAEAVLDIFRALYKRRFPLAKMRLMHHYHGDDDQATTANNTSCHNCRLIKDKKSLSLHAYGTAIDINPVQNPCVYIEEEAGTATYAPTAGIQYANRRLERLGMAYRRGMAEEVVDIFAQYGFYWWGGYWDMPIDYQHFQLTESMSRLYVAMEPKVALDTFRKATHYFNKHQKPLEQVLSQQLEKAYKKECALADYYKQDPKLFHKVLKELTQG